MIDPHKNSISIRVLKETIPLIRTLGARLLLAGAIDKCTDSATIHWVVYKMVKNLDSE